jgi:hypothetical protein
VETFKVWLVPPVVFPILLIAMAVAYAALRGSG